MIFFGGANPFSKMFRKTDLRKTKMKIASLGSNLGRRTRMHMRLTIAACLLAGWATAEVASQAQESADGAKHGKLESNADEESKQRESVSTLTIGDRAPEPKLSEILKGDTSFRKFTREKVTVLEFWATWCGPCLAGMPHLSELQRNHAGSGLTIIGVSAEKPEVVKEFLASPEWDGKTAYTLALDDQSRTNDAYMKAAGRTGIPCAFVIDRSGRIAWIGHPSKLDEPIARILDGDWDLKDARTRYERGETVDEIIRLAEPTCP